MSTSLAAGTAPTGAVHALGLKFLAMDSKFQRFDEASRKHRHRPKSAKYIEADRRCRKYDAARWKAFEGAMTTRARTAADALVQAVHAFDCFCITLDAAGERGGGFEQLTKGALASLIAFLEPLAGLKADAFGWGDTAKDRAAVLARFGREDEA